MQTEENTTSLQNPSATASSQQSTPPKNREQDRELGGAAAVDSEPRVSSPELPAGIQQIAHADLTIEHEIGRGGFGLVNYGLWHGKPVAVKTLQVQHLAAHDLSEFQKEVKMLGQLNFPSIVRFYGACLEPGHLSMVMDYMPRGSLYDILHSDQDLAWPRRFEMGSEIALGLNYLHQQRPEILHRDLKSLNVLVDQNWQVKLCDFGLAGIKLVATTSQAAGKTSKNSDAAAGTTRWKAPELFQRRAKHSPASDVYALGMVLWELASRAIPFSEERSEALVIQWIREGAKEDIPVVCDCILMCSDPSQIIQQEIRQGKKIVLIKRENGQFELGFSSASGEYSIEVLTNSQFPDFVSILKKLAFDGKPHRDSSFYHQLTKITTSFGGRTLPVDWPVDFASVILLCWGAATERPSALVVAEKLRAANIPLAAAFEDLPVDRSVAATLPPVVEIDTETNTGEESGPSFLNRDSGFLDSVELSRPPAIVPNLPQPVAAVPSLQPPIAEESTELLDSRPAATAPAMSEVAAVPSLQPPIAEESTELLDSRPAATAPAMSEAAAVSSPAAQAAMLTSHPLLSRDSLTLTEDPSHPTLYAAIRNRDIDSMHYLLEVAGQDVNKIIPKEGLSYLQFAIQQKAYECIAVLLAHKADVRQLSKTGKPAIFYALDDIEALRYLAAVKGSLDAPDSENQVALTQAFRQDKVWKALIDLGANVAKADFSEDTQIIRTRVLPHWNDLLSQKKDSVMQITDSPFVWAILWHMLGAEDLTRFECPIKTFLSEACRDALGHHVLHYAAAQGNVAWIRWLLINDADINVQTQQKETALSLAIANQHMAIADCFVDNAADLLVDEDLVYQRLTPSEQIFAYCDEEWLRSHRSKLMTRAVADKNVAALIHCWQGSVEKGVRPELDDAALIDFLSQQADSFIERNDLQNEKNNLSAAAQQDSTVQTTYHPEILSYLLAARGMAGQVGWGRSTERLPAKQLGHVFKTGLSLMHYFAMAGDKASLELLAKREVDLMAKTAHGQTLIHIAAEHDQSDLIAWLYEELHLSLEDSDDEGDHPLGAALKSSTKPQGSQQRQQTVAALLRFGACVNYSNRHQCKPFDLCCDADLKRQLTDQHAASGGIDQDKVNQLLLHVARGEQDQAETLIKSGPKILLGSGTVTDFSDRTFTGITAFQYALWAMDWHMWEMILPLLEEVSSEAAREQCQAQADLTTAQGFEGNYKYSELIDALKTHIDQFPALYKANNWDALERLWVHGVGGAQRQVPAHVAQEYCHPDRSFDPTPDFSQKPFPRQLKTTNGDWWAAEYDGGSLGGGKSNDLKGFGVSRYTYSTYTRSGRYGWKDGLEFADAKCCRTGLPEFHLLVDEVGEMRSNVWRFPGVATMPAVGAALAAGKLFEVRTSQLTETRSILSSSSVRPGGHR